VGVGVSSIFRISGVIRTELKKSFCLCADMLYVMINGDKIKDLLPKRIMD
jgi:hypothetical protein